MIPWGVRHSAWIVCTLACASVACRPGPADGEGEGSSESSADESGSEGSTGGEPLDPNVCGDWELDPGAPPMPATPPDNALHFTDVTFAAGLEYRQYFRASGSRQECIFDLHSDDGSLPNADCEPTWFTGGAAVADFDDDGWTDLYVTRLGAPDLLWRNLGDGSFEDVTQAAGLGACTFSSGVAWADLDDDGDQDLLVSAMGGPSHFLYENLGDGSFAERAAMASLDLPVDGMHSGQSFAVGDYDLDGRLDLHVNEWLRTSQYPAGGTFGPRLLRGVGDLAFEDVTQAVGVSMDGVSEKGMFGFSSTFVDLDGDGPPELVVAADFRSSRLFWNGGDGSFADGTVAAGVNRESNAMGSTFADFDGDGRLDWFVTSIAELADDCDGAGCSKWKGTGNRLYQNNGDRTFAEVTDDAGVRDSGWAWGASGFDFDNDGDQDLVAVNGWPGRDLNGGFEHQEMPAVLWQNDGTGVMSPVGPQLGFEDDGQGRAVLAFDFDNDGDLDLFTANHAGRPTLYRNDGGNENDWLRVDVRGTTSNRDGRGAKVQLKLDEDGPVQVREVGVGSHFLGHGERTLHFGLGPDVQSVHELTVSWPASGETQALSDIEPNQVLELVEPG